MRRASEAGITPAQFWRMTGWELDQHLAGYEERIKGDVRTASLLGAWMLAAWCKSPPRADRLAPWAWGKEERKPDEADALAMMDPDDKAAMREALNRRREAARREVDETALAALEEYERLQHPEEIE